MSANCVADDVDCATAVPLRHAPIPIDSHVRQARRRARIGQRSGRVAAEYSNICFVRSRGYEIFTSVISPAGLVVASSLGMTNPVYDGRFKRSTRDTTSSRSFGSKWIP